MAAKKRWTKEKLAPHPPDVVRWRTLKVRKRGGGTRLITIAIRRKRGPRGGRTVATSIRRPRR